jgi:hypothetical protein
MSAFKKINNDDIAVVPYEANKQFNLTYTKLTNICQDGTINDVKILTGQKISTPFNVDIEPINSNQYQKSVYNTINKLFYNQDLKSFNYNINVDFNANFPTNENSFIRVIEIPQSKFGNNIKPNEFILNSSYYNIKDDGNGNLFDLNFNNLQVGNIFYNQGIVVITNQDYKCLLPIEPVIFNKRYNTRLGNSAEVITLLDNAIFYCGQNYETESIEIIENNSLFSYIIQADAIQFIPNVLGTFLLKYRIRDTLGICSNIAEIEINITNNCDFDLTVIDQVDLEKPCISSFTDYNFVKLNNKNCTLNNNIDISFLEYEIMTIRENGINDLKLKFACNNTVSWSFSKDGGLTYFTITTSAQFIEFNTKLNNSSIYFRNAFIFILRASKGESYTEYHFKINPLNLEYYFEKTKEYIDVNLVQVECLSNIYQVVTNQCNITSINWSFTDEMSGIVLAIDKIALLGCRGTVIAEIISSCCTTVTKILTFNGNCLEAICSDSKIELEIIPTKTINNYLIFTDANFYLKEYPNWKFFGNIQFLSDPNATFIEILIKDSDVLSKVIYETKDFCNTLYSLHEFTKIPLVTTSTTTISSSSSTTSKPSSERKSADVDYSDLELTISSNNLLPIANEIVNINILVKNKGFSEATNVIIKLEYDNNHFTMIESSLSNYTFQNINNSYFFKTDLIRVGEYFSIKFKGQVLGYIDDDILIQSQVWEVDQLDPNSIAGNGYNSEDDNKTLKLKINLISNTTVANQFNCSPIIRNFPYTNFICSVFNDYRGSIILNAINPSTNDATGLEYSFNGDIDSYYQEDNNSNLLPNGLYNVWVRLKSNKSCKISTKVRISCLNGNELPTWSNNGEFCIT